MSKTDPFTTTATLPEGFVKLTTEFSPDKHKPKISCKIELVDNDTIISKLPVEKIIEEIKRNFSTGRFTTAIDSNAITLKSNEPWGYVESRSTSYSLKHEDYVLNGTAQHMKDAIQRTISERHYSPLADADDQTTVPMDAKVQMHGTNKVSVTFTNTPTDETKKPNSDSLDQDMAGMDYEDSIRKLPEEQRGYKIGYYPAEDHTIIARALPLATALKQKIEANVQHGHSSTEEITIEQNGSSLILNVTAPTDKTARTLYADLNIALDEMQQPRQASNLHIAKRRRSNEDGPVSGFCP